MITTLADMWERHAHFRPHREAVVFGETRHTFGTLVDRARRIGSALYQHGLRSQDRVAILAMNRAEWFDVYTACEMAGYIIAPINARLAAPEVAQVLADCQPRILIFEAAYTPLVDGLRHSANGIDIYAALDADPPAWAIRFESLLAGDPCGAPIRPQAEDLAHLLYTGGATGRPKGVARSHRASMVLANGNGIIAGLHSGGTQLAVMPMFHIGAQGMAMSQHWVGGRVVLLPRFDPVAVLDAIERERVTMTNLAPTLVHDLLAVPDISSRDLSSLETVCYAAAPMPVSVLKRGLSLLGPIFVNVYGSTEVGSNLFLPKDSHPRHEDDPRVGLLGSVGHPTPFVETRILDDRGIECPPGALGELHIRTRQAMSFYWNNAPATVEALRDGWYSSGDMARMDRYGHIFLVDRKKDMIISGGENVYASEVEETLREHPDVAEASVIGRPDEKWGEVVAAIIVLKEGATVDADNLAAFCGARIAGYKKPRHFRFVETLPRLASGKIDKMALRAQTG